MESAKVRILVVEDNEISQKIAKLVLRPLGCQVDCISTGTAAIESYTQHHYDLIFIDPGLPDIDGLTVAKIIREQEREKGKSTKVPIITLTAHTKASYEKRSLEVGMDYFLEKPLMTNNVLMILKRFLPPNRYRWIKVARDGVSQELCLAG